MELRCTNYHQRIRIENVLLNYDIQYVFYTFYYQSYTKKIMGLHEIRYHIVIIFWVTFLITNRIYLQIVTSKVVADYELHTFFNSNIYKYKSRYRIHNNNKKNHTIFNFINFKFFLNT